MSQTISDAIDDSRVAGILKHAAELALRQKPSATLLEQDYWSWQILLTLRRWDDTTATPLSNVQADPQWKSLLRLPDVPLDHNYDLMAAEHYGYARYVAATYGDPHTDGILRTYFAVKTAVSLLPSGEKLLRTTKNHPVLPESGASRKWMSLGVQQGLLDYRKTHGSHLGPTFSSREVLRSNVGPQYKRALDATAPLPYAKGPTGS